MSSTGFMVVIGVLGLMVICFASHASQSEPLVEILPGNLIQNPGFEEYTAENIPGWVKVTRTEKYAIEIDPTISRTGKNSLKLAWITEERGRTTFGVDQRTRIEPNQQYQLSMWIKKSRPDLAFRMSIRMYDGEHDEEGDFVFRTGSWLHRSQTSPTDPTDWQEWISNNMIFTEEAKYMALIIRFGISFSQGTEKGTTWIDDVRFTRMEDDTFPLTDLSKYKPPARHPILWDPAPERAKIAADGENAVVMDSRNRLDPLSEIKRLTAGYLSPDWSSEFEPHTIDENASQIHYNTALPVSRLSHVYALTGEDKYLQKVKHELLAWVKIFGPGGKNTPFDTAEGFATNNRLREQKFILWMARAFDNIYEALSPEERRAIANDFLKPALATLNRKFGGGGNIQIRQTSATGIVGLVLQDRMLIKKAFHSLGALDYVLRYSVSSKGAWMGDASSSYLRYSFGLLGSLIKAAIHSGLNPYKSPEMQRLITFYPRILFPGRISPAYGDAIWEAGREWNPYENLKKYAKEGTEYEYTSELFSSIGYAILRSGSGVREHIGLGFTYGLPNAHGHSDRLGLILYGSGHLLVPDGRRADIDYTSEVYFPYIQKAVSHNLVTVDEQSFMKGGKKNLHFFANAPEIKTVSASTDGHYPGVLLHRTLTLTNGYVLDIFRAESEEYHRYDWIYNNFGTLVSISQPLSPWKGQLGFTGGYEYITDVRTGRTDSPFEAAWQVEDRGGVRLKMAGAPRTEVITGKGPSRTKEEEPRIPVLIARRRAKNTVFLGVLEPAFGQPKVEEIIELRSEQEECAGAVVRRINGTDTFGLSSVDGLQTFRSADGTSVMSLEGEFGACSMENEELKYVYLVNGTVLKWGNVTITASPSTTVYLGPNEGRFQLENLGDHAAQISVFIGDQESQSTLEAKEFLDFFITGEVIGPAAIRTSTWPAPGLVEKAPVVGRLTKIGENLVMNPSFEESEEGQPVGWKPFSLYPGTNWWSNKVAYDNSVARTGQHSLRLEATKSYSFHTYPAAWISEGIVQNGANGTFRVSAWVKANQPTKVQLCLYGDEPGWGRVADGAVSPVFNVTKEWQKISHTITFGQNITTVNLVLIRPPQWEGKDVWFDDVEVVVE